MRPMTREQRGMKWEERGKEYEKKREGGEQGGERRRQQPSCVPGPSASPA